MAEGLASLDLLVTWQSRHVQPLQSRVHDIGEWSPLGDSTRILTLPLAQHKLASWIRSVSLWMVDGPPQVGRATHGLLDPAPMVILCKNLVASSFPSWAQLDPS